MTFALCTLSHSPLMGVNQPAPDVLAEVDAALSDARAAVHEFAPELVVVFGPDHYNGVFYDMMPPFCLATAATSIGDWETSAGPLDVDRDVAARIARRVLADGIDLAVSERLEVDHGIAQPVEVLFGAVDAVPVVPIFINSVAPPLSPVARVRLLGESVGRALVDLDRRVLFVGSGGLSHDPPVPKLDGATPEVAERLIAGRHPGPEATATRRRTVLAAAHALTEGTATIAPLAPEWDREVMDMLARGRLRDFDAWAPERFAADGGNSAHEVRNWIAAYAGLAVGGPYSVATSYYRPLQEWICGFGVTTAFTTP